MSVDNTADSGPDSRLPLVRASELAQYSFCHRAWWLGIVKGLPSENRTGLAGGKQMHSRHGRRVQAALRWRRAGFFLLISGSLFLTMTLLWPWIF